jgi:hypothetical protein
MTVEVGNLPERLSEVSRLSTLLADQVLMAQAMDRSVPKGHINALVGAAIILDKYEVDLPAPLGQILASGPITVARTA